MARVKFSALLTSVQGTVGGSVFQKNKAGFTLKNKPVVRKNPALKQSAARNFLTVLMSLWRGFSDTERNAWQLYSNYNPTFSKNSSAVLLSGYQLFMKYNLSRMHAGLEPLTSILFEAPYTLSAYCAFRIVVGQLRLVVDDDFDPDLWCMLLHLSEPKRIGYPILSKTYKVIQLAGATGEEINITSAYMAQYARLPQVGQWLAYKAVRFNTNSPAIQRGIFDISQVTV